MILILGLLSKQYHVQTDKWLVPLVDELQSMQNNEVWELVLYQMFLGPVVVSEYSKTKKDSKGKVASHKATLVAKGFTQWEGIDYNGTFSPILTNLVKLHLYLI